MTHFESITCLCLSAVSGAFLCMAAATEVYFSPQCETYAGYNSNRFRTEEAAGSSFLSVKPGFELNVFLTETIDINGLAFYQRNEFLREEFLSSETSGGMIGILHAGGAWATGISFSASVYRDAGFTNSELTQVSCSPEIVYTHVLGARYSLVAFFGESRYESTEPTDNQTFNGFWWSLRPRANWTVSFPLSLWAEGFVEGGSSDERSDEYDGYGVAAGGDYSPPGRLGAAIALQHGSYRQGENTGGRADTFSATVSLSYRANTWAEFRGDAGGGTFWNRDSGVNYDQWRVGVGVRFVYDLEIASFST